MQFFLREPKASALPDVLGWNIMLSPEIVITRQAEFLAIIRYRPRDLASSSPQQLTAARASLNMAIRRFGNGWCLWFEAQRNESADYPSAAWPDPVSQLLDDERRSRFTAPGAQLVSEYFISLLYSPPSDTAGKLAAHFENSGPGDRTTAKRAAAQREIFENGVEQLLGHLKAFMPRAELLAGDDLVTYLHSTVSTQRFKVRQPPIPCFLAEVLADEDYVSGYYPRLGDHHMRTLRIKDFGDDTCPGVLDELNRLDFPFRNVCRWLPFDREDAMAFLESERKSWESSRLGLLAHFMPKLFTARNMEAELGTEEAEAALTALASGAVSGGWYSHTITVTHPNVDIVNDRMKRVALIIHGKGLVCSEAKVDSMSAWLGSVPGHPAADLGRYLMNSLTFSELVPATAPWDGHDRDEHLGGPALLRGMSDGGSPFNLALHQAGSDVGHTLVIGETGCHAKGTMILMSDGRMLPVEDIVVGDEVMGANSGGRTVTALHRGSSEMVRITPVKGEPFDVNMDHILSLVRTNVPAGRGGEIVNISVRDWLLSHKTFKAIHKLYRCAAEFDTPKPILPCDPYILGALLGDGNLAHASTPQITNPDFEVYDEVVRLSGTDGFVVTNNLPNSTGCPVFGMVSPTRKLYTNPISMAIRALGLWRVASEEKFIPLIYKTSTKPDRLRLLAGLLDTDGSMSHGGYDFIAKSKAVAEDISFVARSVGLAAYVSECTKGCQGNFSGTYFRVSISGDCSIIPCLIARKKAPARTQNKSVLRTGFAVCPTGRGDFYGFECDGDHLYLDGTFTAHHNSGKSVVLSRMAASHRKYPDSRVIFIDRGESSKCVTLALGGSFHSLAADDAAVSLQPLAFIDEPAERAWADEFIVGCLAGTGVIVSPHQREEITRALEALATRAPHHRTLTALRLMVQDAEVKIGLAPFCHGGANGDLLDCSHQSLGSGADVTAFETAQLLERVTAVGPVMACVFHAIERGFDGRPTLLILDEAWSLLSHPLIEARLRSWLKTARKAGVAVVMATQSMADIANSSIREVLSESAPSRIFTANSRAQEAATSATLTGFGLTPEQIGIIAAMRPKSQYAYAGVGVWRSYGRNWVMAL